MKAASFVALFCAVCMAPLTILAVHTITRNVETQVLVAERNQAETIKVMLEASQWQDSVKFWQDSVKVLHRRHNREILYGRELWRDE